MVATELSTATFREAHRHVAAHAHRTPLLTSRTLSDATGFDVLLKAESFQRTGSYKIRGPLNKFTHLSDEEKRAGVIARRPATTLKVSPSPRRCTESGRSW